MVAFCVGCMCLTWFGWLVLLFADLISLLYFALLVFAWAFAVGIVGRLFIGFGWLS